MLLCCMLIEGEFELECVCWLYWCNCELVVIGFLFVVVLEDLVDRLVLVECLFV